MKKIFALILVHLLLSGLVSAQTGGVPAVLQGALFKKVFNLNKTLQAKGIKLAVVYGDQESRDEMVEAFKQQGLFPVAVQFKDIEKEIGKFTVIYITQGCGSIKTLTDKHKIFSISGQAALAEKGEVSLAIGVESSKPKIIVNKKKIDSEGQELSSDLLKVAKVL